MSWTEAEARFAENFAGYEPRIPQRGFATAIETSLTDGVHILAQAGCGVGKSYGAMVPAIDHALATGQPVVAATATKALQDQYIRDMQKLQEIYRPFTFTVLKGRGNYLCRAKMDKVDESRLSFDMDEVRQAAEQPDVMGDVDRLPVVLAPSDRPQLLTGSDECPGKSDCPFGERCFAEAAKKRAATSDVVITNHSMLAIDAVLKADGVSLLPAWSGLVIDEAHEFAEYVTNALGSDVSERSLTSLATEVTNFLGDSKYALRAGDAARALTAKLNAALGRENSIALTPSMIVALNDEVMEVLAALDEMDGDVSYHRAKDESESLRKKRLRKRLGNLANKMRSTVLADFADVVRWAERDPKRGVLLCQAPLDVAPFLKVAVWPWGPAALVSATLSVGSDFSFIANRLGLQVGDECRTFDAGSPFDFATQAVLYAPKDLPDPSKERVSHKVSVAQEMARLVKASNGRALLLFTSWTALNEAYAVVAPVVRGLGHQVLKQGDMPTRRLAETFAADEHSVLFAVKSFFTGVDVQGDSLRLVAIDKMPFPNPGDILFKARCDAVDAKVSESEKWTKGSFSTMSVPEMTLTLLQVFGRLIRTMDDRGVVAILDPRLHSKPYGRKVLKALPDAPVVTMLADAESRLTDLEVSV